MTSRGRSTQRVLILLALVAAVLFVVAAGAVGQTETVAQEDEPVLISEQPVPESVERSEPTADHTKFEILQGPFVTGPDLTTACLSCHTEAAKQVQGTTHWTWDNHYGEGVGKTTQINNFCIGVQSNEPRCTSCHTGYGWTDNSYDFTVEENVDCVSCHDTTGTYKKFPTAAGHPAYEPTDFNGVTWNPPDLAMIAQNVGKTSNETCGACHFNGGGGAGVKHGDLNPDLLTASMDLDVHMSVDGAGMVCSDCHEGNNHQINGSSVYMSPSDDSGVDLPLDDGDQATCQSCHGTQPMDSDKLNEHTDKVACQTCHIPTLARGETYTKTWWDWSTAGEFAPDGAKITTKDENGNVDYTTIKGDFEWDRDFVPDYVWFNGIVDVTIAGDPVVLNDNGVMELNAYSGSYDDEHSRIYPVKAFRGIQPIDAGNNTVALPHLFGKDDAAYWKSFDWNTAIAAGMAVAGSPYESNTGVPYSGEVGWMETVFYEPATHMVAPSGDAVECQSCHSRDGVLASLGGFYLPGRDGGALDWLMWGLIALTLVVVIVHGVMRIVGSNRRSS